MSHQQRLPRRKKPSDARGVAFDTLELMETDEAFLQFALERMARAARLEPRDRALALQLVMGVCRFQARLDHELGAVARQGLDSIPQPVLTAQRLALFQIRHLDRVPSHAAVNAAVDQARSVGGEGAARLTNGMLRTLLRKPVEMPIEDNAAGISVRHSHPKWLVERWLKAHGRKATIARCEANNSPAPLTIRLDHRGEVDRDDLFDTLYAEDGTFEDTAAPHGGHLTGLAAPFSSASFKAGWWVAQDEASQWVVQLLDPQPGETVWDVCAAPGGKTRYIAWLMKDNGRILATDVNRRRAERLREAVADLQSVRVQVHDGAEPMGGPPPFDRVLVDAPCTALGLLRRHPEIRWRRTPRDILRNSKLQRRVLEAAAAGLKPGGTLVYSVCSDAPEEGPEVIAGFLADHPEFEVVPVDPEVVGDPRRVTDGFLTTGPHLLGADGFFAARLRRAPEGG